MLGQDLKSGVANNFDILLLFGIIYPIMSQREAGSRNNMKFDVFKRQTIRHTKRFQGNTAEPPIHNIVGIHKAEDVDLLKKAAKKANLYLDVTNQEGETYLPSGGGGDVVPKGMIRVVVFCSSQEESEKYDKARSAILLEEKAKNVKK